MKYFLSITIFFGVTSAIVYGASFIVGFSLHNHPNSEIATQFFTPKQSIRQIASTDAAGSLSTPQVLGVTTQEIDLIHIRPMSDLLSSSDADNPREYNLLKVLMGEL